MNSTLSLTRNKTAINFKTLLLCYSIKNNNTLLIFNENKSLSKRKVQNLIFNNKDKNLNSKKVSQDN